MCNPLCMVPKELKRTDTTLSTTSEPMSVVKMQTQGGLHSLLLEYRPQKEWERRANLQLIKDCAILCPVTYTGYAILISRTTLLNERGAHTVAMLCGNTKSLHSGACS